MTTPNQLCTFWAADHLFGIAVKDIREVRWCGDITDVPRSGRAIRGLTNVRGELLCLLDLRRRLGFDGGRESLCVVLRSDEPVGLLVDEVGDVIDLPPAERLETPENLPETIRDAVVGLYAYGTQTIAQLDVVQLLQPQHLILEAGDLA